ncbi:MAG: phosphoglucosamine mutase, partial [Candidatus Omnitrophota bacterium]
RKLEVDMGIMISASHNKPTENGIKFLTEQGHRLSAEDEEWMEQLILGSLIHTPNGSAHRRKGGIIQHKDAPRSYIEFLQSVALASHLEGLKVALDCAYGATSKVARQFFEQLQIKVYSIHDTPDGKSINCGGVVNPSFLRALVLESNADVGFAFDGDGDRIAAVDETGTILDGDDLMGIIVLYLLQNNKLSKNTFVATQMSNQGFILCLEQYGAKVLYTHLGEKNILSVLLHEGLNFGGEKSGHILMLDYAPTSDGLLTALQILKIMKATQKPLSELARCIHKHPQVFVNVRVKQKRPFVSIPPIWNAIVQSKEALKGKGRLLVRYSGTEDLVRIMVEGADELFVRKIASSLARTFEKEIGIEEMVEG